MDNLTCPNCGDNTANEQSTIKICPNPRCGYPFNASEWKRIKTQKDALETEKKGKELEKRKRENEEKMKFYSLINTKECPKCGHPITWEVKHWGSYGPRSIETKFDGFSYPYCKKCTWKSFLAIKEERRSRIIRYETKHSTRTHISGNYEWDEDYEYSEPVYEYYWEKTVTINTEEALKNLKYYKEQYRKPGYGIFYDV